MTKSPYLALIIAVAAVSTGAVFARLADAPPLVTAAYRVGIASLILAPVAYWKAKDELLKLSGQDIKLAMLSGFFLALHFAAWISSLNYTSIANSVVLVNTNPLWAALLTPFVTKERIRPSAIISIFISVIGGLIIGAGDFAIGGQALVGDFLASAGSICAAVYLLLGRNLRRKLSLLTYIFICYSSAAVILWCAVLSFQMQITGTIALKHLLAQCEFTKAKVLNTELAVSEVSGRRYRRDEQMSSVISGKRGHKSEFLIFYETRQPLLFSEAEQCEVSGNYVKKGILEQCEVSQKRVLPSELARCAVTGKRVLKKFLVISSLSETRFLEEIAIRSATEKYCTPVEAKPCSWSGRKCHPDDLRVCNLIGGLSIHFEYATTGNNPRLQSLIDLLNGMNRTANNREIWNDLTIKIAEILGRGKEQCRVESAILSPDGQSLAVCSEVRTWFGFKVRQAGFVYSISNKSVIGKVVQGQRTSEGWSE